MPRDQLAGERGRRHGNRMQKGVWGVVQWVECGEGEESDERRHCYVGWEYEE